MEMYKRSTMHRGQHGSTKHTRLHLLKHIYARLSKNADLNKHTLMISIQMDFLADFQMRSVDGQHVAKPN